MRPCLSWRFLTALLVALTVATSVASGFGEPNRFYKDGGRGNDAGSTRATAAVLPGFDTYGAYHLPYDNDWFAVNSTSSSPVCIQANILSQIPGQVRLALETPAGPRETYGPLASGVEFPMAIATRSLDRVFYNYDGTTSNVHGDYIFELNRTDLASLVPDAGTGRDASSSLANATPVPGACFAGSLDPMLGLGDTRDAYSFQGTAGQVVLLSYAPVADVGSLTLYAPDGSSVLGVLAPGGMSAITLPQTGSYRVAASATGPISTDYLIGLVVGPPGSGCEPTC